MSRNPRYVRPPVSTSFNNINFGSSSKTDFGNSVYLYVPYNNRPPGTDDLVGLRLQSFSGGGPATMICNVQMNMADRLSNGNMFSPLCIGIDDNSTNYEVIDVRLFDASVSLGQSLNVTQWSGVSNISSVNYTDQGAGGPPFSENHWFMVKTDGTTTRYYLTTDDCQTWVQFYSSNAVLPRDIFIGCNNRGYSDVNLIINSLQILPY